MSNSAFVASEETSTFRFGAATDPGTRRQFNEDLTAHIQSACGSIFVVADGMGGPKSGPVASEMTVSLLEELLKSRTSISSTDLKAAVKGISHSIYDRAKREVELAGMGSTIVGAAFVGRSLIAFNVGNSRLYRIRDNEIVLITVDHTLYQELLTSGAVEKQPSVNKPIGHMLTRSLGTAPTVDVDAVVITPEPAAGDFYILCTDGLHDVVSEEEIKTEALSSPPEEAAGTLIALGRTRGAIDNLSIMVVECERIGGSASAEQAHPTTAGASVLPAVLDKTNATNEDLLEVGNAPAAVPGGTDLAAKPAAASPFLRLSPAASREEPRESESRHAVDGGENAGADDAQTTADYFDSPTPDTDNSEPMLRPRRGTDARVDAIFQGGRPAARPGSATRYGPVGAPRPRSTSASKGTPRPSFLALVVGSLFMGLVVGSIVANGSSKSTPVASSAVPDKTQAPRASVVAKAKTSLGNSAANEVSLSSLNEKDRLAVQTLMSDVTGNDPILRARPSQTVFVGDASISSVPSVNLSKDPLFRSMVEEVVGAIRQVITNSDRKLVTIGLRYERVGAKLRRLSDDIQQVSHANGPDKEDGNEKPSITR